MVAPAATLPPGPEPGPMTAEGAPLRGHVASGVRWGVLNQAVQQVTRLGVQVVLSRLLAPDQFGIMAIAFLAVNLGALLSGLGFAQALVQRRQITEGDVRAAFTASIGLGVVLAAIVAVLADPFASFFDEPDVTPILQVMGLTFVIRGAEGVPNSMLRRDLRFREYVLSSTIAAVAGSAVAVVLAVLGAGVWALVGFAVAEAGVATALAWVLAVAAGVWRPALTADLRPLGALAGYSGAVTGSRLLAYGARNVDNLIVGRALGATALGYYGLAYRLMLFPIQRLTEVVTSVTLPAFARLHADPTRLGDAFLRSVRYLALILLPVTVGVAVTAPALVPAVFGDKWRPAIDALRILALAGPGLALSRLNGILWEATGRAGMSFLVNGAGLVLLVPAFLIGVEHGVAGVAVAYTATVYLGLLPSLWLVSWTAGVSPGRQLANVGRLAAATAFMAGAAALAGGAVPPSLGAAAELAIMVVAGGATYAGALLVLDRPLVRSALSDFRLRPS